MASDRGLRSVLEGFQRAMIIHPQHYLLHRLVRECGNTHTHTHTVVVRPWESGMRCMVECHFPTV